jgi:hypothetical protein
MNMENFFANLKEAKRTWDDKKCLETMKMVFDRDYEKAVKDLVKAVGDFEAEKVRKDVYESAGDVDDGVGFGRRYYGDLTYYEKEVKISEENVNGFKELKLFIEEKLKGLETEV